MTTLSHPFKDGSKDVIIPKDKIKDVDEIQKWIKSQETLPTYSRMHAYLFLHACLFDKEATKRALKKYASIRAGSPDLFDSRDPMHEDIQQVYRMAHMVAMPKTTPEGYQILIYRLSDTDPSKMKFAEAVKAFCMFNDVRISEDKLAQGYVVVFDMKGLRLGHLTRVKFGPMKAYMSYIQEAHPVRLKKIYIVNTNIFINQIMSLLKPLIKSELLGLLEFTSQGPSEKIPLELLPQCYGGPLDKIENYHNEQQAYLEKEYRDWLIDSGKLKENLNGNIKNCKNHNTENVKAPVKKMAALDFD